MSKTTITLAAALIAGTTLTSAARADAVRLGFGFPLGSFVAHSNENSGGSDYRRADRPRYVRHDYQDDAPARKIAKTRRPPKPEVADASAKAPITSAVQTAKLEDKLSSDPATTTVIAKSSGAKGNGAPTNTTTTGSVARPEGKPSINDNKVATDEKPVAKKTNATETKHICRRYSPAIAALIDVPCE